MSTTEAQPVVSAKEALIAEFKHETANNRKILERVPEDNGNYQPHEKSMLLHKLAQHIATLPEWTVFTLNQSELDLGGNFARPEPYKNNEELLAMHDKHVAEALEALENFNEEEFSQPWTLRSGSHVVFTMPKGTVLRSMVYSHMIHHRAQLGVYLRLLNIPIPGFYGPTADEKN